MRPDLLLQQGDQFGLHEGVVVRDVEADDAGRLQVRSEAALEFGAVGALHDEDDVGPVEVVGVTGSSASGASPAEAVSTPGRPAKTRSAVGDRRRLRAQRKRRLVTQAQDRRSDAGGWNGAVRREPRLHPPPSVSRVDSGRCAAQRKSS